VRSGVKLLNFRMLPVWILGNLWDLKHICVLYMQVLFSNHDITILIPLNTKKTTFENKMEETKNEINMVFLCDVNVYGNLKFSSRQQLD
jgi:hypothetical protein